MQVEDSKNVMAYEAVGSEYTECCICMDANSSVILQPCGHKVLCNNCYLRIKKRCPICRCTIINPDRKEDRHQINDQMFTINSLEILRIFLLQMADEFIGFSRLNINHQEAMMMPTHVERCQAKARADRLQIFTFLSNLIMFCMPIFISWQLLYNPHYYNEGNGNIFADILIWLSNMVYSYYYL